MKHIVKQLIIVLSILAFVRITDAETRVVGNVNGHWIRNGSPYVATGDLFLQDNQALEIDPGVEVRFEGNYTFYIYGEIASIGEEGDSILFTLSPGGEAWGGLRFLNTERARLDYCVVTYGRATRGEGEIDTLGSGGNIFISGGDVIIDHSRISHGRSRSNGGGVGMWHSQAVIRNTLINENESLFIGGGISVVAFSNPVLTNCRIVDNTSPSAGGGAFIFNESDPLFDACVFQSNTCTHEAGNGGGVYVAEASSPRFTKTQFLENSGSAGGGVYVRGQGSNAIFEWCYFWGNATNVGSRVGGGMYVRGGAGVSVAYTRFVENNSNQGGGLYVKEPPHMTIDHCLFLGNAATRAGGAVAASTDLGETPLKLNNCTFINNRNIGGEPIAHTAYARRPVEQAPGSMIVINSSIIYGPQPLFGEENRVQVNWSNIVDGFPGTANTSDDPGFFPGDSVWYVLSGDSRCIDTGDTLLPNDRDRSRTDRGWLHFPHDAWDNLSDEPLSADLFTDQRVSVDFEYTNETGVPIYVSPMDRWNEGEPLLSLEVSTLTSDTDIEAVAWTEGGFFLAGGSNGEDPNLIYVLDDSLEVVGDFEQPGEPPNAGFTDLSTDGLSVIYGTSEDGIVEFSVDGEFGQDYEVPNGVDPCSAIGADFANSDQFVDFYLGDYSGTLMRTDAGMSSISTTTLGDSILAIGVKGNTRAAYAITPYDSTKSLLWLVLPDDQNLTPLYFLNLEEGYSYGGMEVSQKYREGRGTLIGILKGFGEYEDVLYALDLYTSWLVIKPRLALLMPGESAEWSIEFAGDQMPAGRYRDNFVLAVNGYGADGEVAAEMNTEPGSVRQSNGSLPQSVELMTPYPNPFNSEVRLSFVLASKASTKIWLTDASGRNMGVIAENAYDAGKHTVSFNAKALPSGQYFVRLETSGGTAVRPLTLMR